VQVAERISDLPTIDIKRMGFASRDVMTRGEILPQPATLASGLSCNPASPTVSDARRLAPPDAGDQASARGLDSGLLAMPVRGRGFSRKHGGAWTAFRINS
jgi:hypothetical protein